MFSLVFNTTFWAGGVGGEPSQRFHVFLINKMKTINQNPRLGLGGGRKFIHQ
jgi:hypothetical protein